MLAILTTHPIQYQVPLWQRLALEGEIPFEVWYMTRHGISLSHDVEFDRSFAWDLDLLSGYPHRFLEASPGATPASFWRCRLRESLAARMRASGVRAIWIQGWQVAGYWQAAWAAQSVRAEVWLRGESNDLATTPIWKRGIKRLLIGQLFQRVDRFLYIGAANKRLYQNYGVSDTRLYPAPYAVDNERFARQAEELRNQRSRIRREWGIPERAFCILFCGKFISKKRPTDLVKAAQLMMSNGRLPNLHLLFVGSGHLGAQLRAECDVVYDAESLPHAKPAADEKPPASFAGFLNQTAISKAYVAADCLVLSSDYGETWGLVVNEAMASGLPCIISDQCGCALDLGERVGNSVYHCGDIVALASCLKGVHEQSASGRSSPPSLQETVATAKELYAERL